MEFGADTPPPSPSTGPVLFPPPPQGLTKVCLDVGQGLWVEQNRGNGAQTNTAEFNYNTTNNGFTLIYQGAQLADLEFTTDSGRYEWPIMRPEYRSECACCDLCKAQPNPSVSGQAGWSELTVELCCAVLWCAVVWCGVVWRAVLCCVAICCIVLCLLCASSILSWL
jgi:hypothetical protein